MTNSMKDSVVSQGSRRVLHTFIGSLLIIFIFLCPLLLIHLREFTKFLFQLKNSIDGY
jgi:hypothetical protein